MAIAESDISVLIPTYRYRRKVVRAVESALESGAGEIIVVDDRGLDGTIEELARFSDPRLTVIENERNLGLWENHLKALHLATRPWIKFIQADDYLLPGGLAKFAAAAGPDVAIVSGAPIIVEDDSVQTQLLYRASQPILLDFEGFEKGCQLYGWFLGHPSLMMLRADVITRATEVWRREISADLVVGSLAATKGRIVMLPPGAVCHGGHAGQDSRTQLADLGLARSSNSLAYLRRTGDPRLRRLADAWTVLDAKSTIRTAIRGLIRSEGSARSIVLSLWRYFTDPGLTGWRCGLRRPVLSAIRYRRSTRPPYDLDEIFASTLSAPERQ